MKRLLLFLLATINTTKSVPNEIRSILEYTTLEPPGEPPSIIETVPTYDYIIEIGFKLNEEKVPEYLIDIIYDEAPKRAVTTNDVFSLYGLKTINLTTTLDFLSQLNIPSEDIFSLDGFDKFLAELTVDFKEFYNRVIIGKLNITGNPLRDALESLNIDVNNFSMGMAYGNPDPYEEFKKGNYSKECVESALQKSNRTFDELFIASRDEFLSKALTLEIKRIIESLLKYGFHKPKALELWKALNLTVENVYKVPVFKKFT
ncbi:hypothetical protein NQ314_014934 [Rhamnusium bicolor]|uniref:Uncharacterized protein n=1 Tax=Rhamnusium bicolor TaxID=1586634 RepID=A0AAV8X187_9CUCU|nr:hypothetical protein NQ314_014934 [Rhamnusium bicolor]